MCSIIIVELIICQIINVELIRCSEKIIGVYNTNQKPDFRTVQSSLSIQVSFNLFSSFCSIFDHLTMLLSPLPSVVNSNRLLEH